MHWAWSATASGTRPVASPLSWLDRQDVIGSTMNKIGFGLLGVCLLGALPAFAVSGADSRLVTAVRGNDHVALKRLLAAKVNVNAPLPDQTTVLAWAVN